MTLPRAYSEKPSAVRMRRMREKRKKLEQLRLLSTAPAPNVITWHCGCGAQLVVFQGGAISLDAWADHRRACLFVRAAFPVVLERKPRLA